MRTVQLGLAAADEMRAQERYESERALAERIGQLADAIAPAPQSLAATSFGAAAHYRARLHHSAATARERVDQAGHQADAASEARRSAHRDQNAVERLIARVESRAVVKERRAMEDQPPARRSVRADARGVRHDPC